MKLKIRYSSSKLKLRFVILLGTIVFFTGILTQKERIISSLSKEAFNTKTKHQLIPKVTGKKSSVYISNTKNLEINIPIGYTVEELPNAIILKNASSKQSIHLLYYGTNFNSTNTHLDYLVKMNGFNFSERKTMTFPNGEWVKTKVNDPDTISYLTVRFPRVYVIESSSIKDASILESLISSIRFE